MRGEPRINERRRAPDFERMFGDVTLRRLNHHTVSIRNNGLQTRMRLQVEFPGQGINAPE